jgi:hypothetical protein
MIHHLVFGCRNLGLIFATLVSLINNKNIVILTGSLKLKTAHYHADAKRYCIPNDY